MAVIAFAILALCERAVTQTQETDAKKLFDDAYRKIRALVTWKYGEPRPEPHTAFEGAVLNDEKLEREIFEAIKANALIARKIIPLRIEVDGAAKRVLAMPPIDTTKPYHTGRRGPEIEYDLIQKQLGQAMEAENRVARIMAALSNNLDVRNVRLYACLLWEPGEYIVEGDVGHGCLRHSAWNRLGDCLLTGVLNIADKPQNDAAWRTWWLENRWQWGWSYEIEPITSTEIFSVPSESGFVPRQDPPKPEPAPAPPTPAPQRQPAPSSAAPAVVPTEEQHDNTLLYSTLGVVIFVFAAMLYKRGKQRDELENKGTDSMKAD